MEFRIERDTFGEIKVQADRLWGAQTERSKQNFRIGTETMPIEIIHAFAVLKKSAAKSNYTLGHLCVHKMEAITYATDEIIAGRVNDHFPLVVWQTGSGTQSNMNVNEVIANLGNAYLQSQGKQERLHPNDDVNMSQSSNDTFPTALHVSALLAVEQHLLPAIDRLANTLRSKADQYQNIIKVGRTHLQDATPLTLGQEMSGWVAMLNKNKRMIVDSMQYLRELAIGGTAVGTGVNAHPKFGTLTAQHISEFVRQTFVSAPNKFHALTSHDEIVFAHGALKALAADLMKIANDVRWLASGPRSGLCEIRIPENEPGSSIMPGKVNPTQSEALTMVVAQVIGNDVTIGMAASQGNFQLNVFKPVIIYNFLQSVRLLSDGMVSFHDKCAVGIEPNVDKIEHNLRHSLMLVTALNPHIGYEKAAKIAKLAHQQNSTLREAALQTGFVTEQQFDEYIDVTKMI